MKKEKGITLIALVITIIVLLILAGISIATLTGENGILTKASIVKRESRKVEIEEQIKLAVMTARINKDNININLDILEKELIENYGIMGIEKQGEDGNLPWKITHEGYVFQIKEDGTVEEVNGISLNETTLKLIAGESKTLIATKTGGISGNIIWSVNSSDVTVDNNGNVKVAEDAKGMATVTAKIEGTNYSATCTIIILSKVESIAVNDFSVDTNQTKTIKVITNPTENIEELTYTYTTTSSNIMIDNEKGAVKGVKEGSATITVIATRKNGTQLGPITFSVTVTKPVEPKIGDFVNYSAGNWTKEDINKLGSYYSGKSIPPAALKFSGFEIGDSKDTCITPYESLKNRYSGGWRILNINSNKTYTLIHAGTPEAFYSNWNNPARGMYILSGTVSSGYKTPSDVTPRNWSMYEDDGVFVEPGSARHVSYEEINSLSQSDTLRTIGAPYYLPFIGWASSLTSCGSNGEIVKNGNAYHWGIRPVVALRANVKLTPKEEQRTHNTLETAWQLEK